MTRSKRRVAREKPIWWNVSRAFLCICHCESQNENNFSSFDTFRGHLERKMSNLNWKKNSKRNSEMIIIELRVIFHIALARCVATLQAHFCMSNLIFFAVRITLSHYRSSILFNFIFSLFCSLFISHALREMDNFTLPREGFVVNCAFSQRYSGCFIFFYDTHVVMKFHDRKCQTFCA